MARSIMVFVERRDGEIKRPSLEALGEARRLADGAGSEVVALVVGSGAGAAGGELGAQGADRVLAVEHDGLDLYSGQGYAAAASHAVEQADAGRVLIAGTMLGRDLGPRLAARLGCGCLSDLVELEATAGGGLRGRRPVYSGKAYARVATGDGARVVAVLRPNAFKAAEADSSRSAAVESLAAPEAVDQVGARAVRIRRSEQQEQDVAEASVIVSGGRGMKAAEHFSLIRELADALGGAVGASRAVVDDGWIGHAHQVGQTGKVVAPELYVACGISGQIQHLAGMSTSKVIVAINKDPDAPIFKVADYGIVGDVFDVLPKLTERVREAKG